VTIILLVWWSLARGNQVVPSRWQATRMGLGWVLRLRVVWPIDAAEPCLGGEARFLIDSRLSFPPGGSMNYLSLRRRVATLAVLTTAVVGSGAGRAHRCVG